MVASTHGIHGCIHDGLNGYAGLHRHAKLYNQSPYLQMEIGVQEHLFLFLIIFLIWSDIYACMVASCQQIKSAIYVCT